MKRLNFEQWRKQTNFEGVCLLALMLIGVGSQFGFSLLDMSPLGFRINLICIGAALWLLLRTTFVASYEYDPELDDY